MIRYYIPEGFEECIIVDHSPYLYIEVPGSKCAIDQETLEALSPEECDELEAEIFECLESGMDISHSPHLADMAHDIVRRNPELRRTVLSGFFDEAWHILKTGKTKEETRELDKVKKYLEKHWDVEKDLAAVLKTSQNFEKLLEDHEEEFAKNPELFQDLADTIELHPDLKESIRKEIVEGIPIRVETPLRKLPGVSKENLTLPESELVGLVKDLLKYKGLRYGEDYKKISVLSGGEGPRDRKLLLSTDAWGLTKITQAFPELLLKKVA